jgi:hypothetical protein
LRSKRGVLTTGFTCSVIAAHANFRKRNLFTVDIFRYIMRVFLKIIVTKQVLTKRGSTGGLFLKKIVTIYFFKKTSPSVFLFSTLLVKVKILVRHLRTIRTQYFRVFLDRTVISVLSETFSAFYETRSVISAFARSRH